MNVSATTGTAVVTNGIDGPSPHKVNCTDSRMNLKTSTLGMKWQNKDDMKNKLTLCLPVRHISEPEAGQQKDSKRH